MRSNPFGRPKAKSYRVGGRPGGGGRKSSPGRGSAAYKAGFQDALAEFRRRGGQVGSPGRGRGRGQSALMGGRQQFSSYGEDDEGFARGGPRRVGWRF